MRVVLIHPNLEEFVMRYRDLWRTETRAMITGSVMLIVASIAVVALGKSRTTPRDLPSCSKVSLKGGKAMTTKHTDRRPLPLWAIMLVFVIGSIALVVFHRRSTQPPRDLREMEQAIRKAKKWQVTPSATTPIVDTGFYISRQKLAWSDLTVLPLNGSHRERWAGVVFCRNADEYDRISWGGDTGIYSYNGFTFFGDTELITEIVHYLRSPR